MAIFKSSETTDYVVIPNKTAQDSSLSWEARGMLCMMLSLPSDWAIHVSWLVEQSPKCKRDKVMAILKELAENGYIVKSQAKSDDGKFSGNDYSVFSKNDSRVGNSVNGKTVNGKTDTTKEISLQNKQETKKDLKDMSVSAKHDGSVSEIFAYWQSAMNSHRSKLGADKRKKILTALKTYSVEEIKKAILGCSMTPFNMGDNDQQTKYNGLDLILRNSEKIDKFISHADNPPAARKQKQVIDNNDTSWGKDFGDIY